MTRNEIITEHYKKNYDKLLKTTIWKVPDRSKALAEECIQEAYARALNYFATFDPKRDDFDKWFKGILRNAINDCRTIEQEHGITVELKDDETVPLIPTRNERYSALYILHTMEESITKRILLYFLMYGFNAKEIGQIVGVKHGTVRQTIARWRNKRGI